MGGREGNKEGGKKGSKQRVRKEGRIMRENRAQLRRGGKKRDYDLSRWFRPFCTPTFQVYSKWKKLGTLRGKNQWFSVYHGMVRVKNRDYRNNLTFFCLFHFDLS